MDLAAITHKGRAVRRRLASAGLLASVASDLSIALVMQYERTLLVFVGSHHSEHGACDAVRAHTRPPDKQIQGCTELCGPQYEHRACGAVQAQMGPPIERS